MPTSSRPSARKGDASNRETPRSTKAGGKKKKAKKTKSPDKKGSSGAAEPEEELVPIEEGEAEGEEEIEVSEGFGFADSLASRLVRCPQCTFKCFQVATVCPRCSYPMAPAAAPPPAPTPAEDTAAAVKEPAVAGQLPDAFYEGLGLVKIAPSAWSTGAKPQATAKPRRPIVGGNWKCNPQRLDQLPELVANINACDTSGCDMYVCPSVLHMGVVYDSFTNGAKVAPQNCNFKGCGAYTGEMSAEQMVDLGLEWCLIGHSERRGEFGLPTPAEPPELIADVKLGYLLSKGLKAILAIGEPLAIREQGLEATVAFCVEQLKPAVPHMKAAGAERIVLAYEPVWSIGTGVTATPAQAQETHAALRKWLADSVSPGFAQAVRIQYGGSANAKNAAELSACADVDGFLVGGASLKPEIAEIVAALSAAKA